MINNVTEYTIDKYKQLERKDYQKSYLIIFLASLIGTFLFSLLYMLSEDNPIFYLILALSIFLLSSIYILSNYFKKPKINQIIVRDYTFYEEQFEVVSSNKGNRSSTVYTYEKIKKYKFDKFNLYIYLTKPVL